MHPRLPLVILWWAFGTLTAAQPKCDPITQYEKLGQCCKMCGPGTSMTSLGTCQEPQCQTCGPNEYQDEQTKDLRCQRQPYCDPNLGFQEPKHDIKKRTTCLCKEGYHCVNKGCAVCEKHSTCKPGHVVKSNGTHLKDTVCGECPDGTYSDGSPAFTECKKWTECEPGQAVRHDGTNASDRICEPFNRHHVIIAVIFAVVGIIAVLLAVLICCRAKRAKGRFKLQEFDEALHGKLKEPLKKPPSPVIIHILQEQPDDPLPRTPEENMHEPSQEIETMSDVGLTEKGQCVVQENGKTELLSRQESQTQTFSG